MITLALFKNFSNKQVYFEPDTGLPYTIEIIHKKVYMPVEKQEEHKFPERFRQFAVINGNYIGPYIRYVNRMSGKLESEVATLLNHFPTWESIKDSDEWAEHGVDEWDETKHNLFKECLEWCNIQGGFWCKWPY